MISSRIQSNWPAAVTVAGLFFGYVFVQRVAPGVMVTDLMRDFDASGAVMGNLSAFYFYSYASLQIIVGAMMDRFGPRRLMTLAALICGAGSVLFSVADSLALAYAGRLMIGIGAAFSFVGALTVIHQCCPPEKFSFLSGIVQAAGMGGALLGQAPLGLWVEASGWREPLLFGGLFAGLVGLAAWMVLRDPPEQDRTDSPLPPGMFSGLVQVCRNPQTWLAAIVGGSLTAPMLAFGGLWGVPFLQSTYGYDRPTAAAFTGALFIGWAVGAPVTGWLSDRWDRRRPILVAGAISMTVALALVVWLPPLPVPVLVLLLAINGFGSSSMILTFAAARASNPAASTGLALGIVNTCVVGSGAITQPLLGSLLDINWTGDMLDGARIYHADAYQLAFLPLLIAGLAGAACAMRLSPRGKTQARRAE
ncbi:MAG: MFS transporter [Rhodospirillales bacterium]